MQALLKLPNFLAQLNKLHKELLEKYLKIYDSKHFLLDKNNEFH